MTKERQVICEEIKMIQDQPDDLVHDNITELVFKDAPLGNSIIGTKTSLSRITRPVITAYKEKAYARDSIVISAAGNFDKDAFCAYLSDKFDRLAKERRAERKESRGLCSEIQSDKKGYTAVSYLYGDKEHKLRRSKILYFRRTEQYHGRKHEFEIFPEYKRKKKDWLTAYTLPTALSATPDIIIYMRESVMIK